LATDLDVEVKIQCVFVNGRAQSLVFIDIDSTIFEVNKPVKPPSPSCTTFTGNKYMHAVQRKRRLRESPERCFCLGSGSGSASFWASRIRIRVHYSEVWIRILPFSHKNKNVERTEIMLDKIEF
jgi:hypothetical protein